MAKSNLTHRERKALNKLANNTIRTGDKLKDYKKTVRETYSRMSPDKQQTLITEIEKDAELYQ